MSPYPFFSRTIAALFLALVLFSRAGAYTSNDYYQAGLSFYQKGDYPQAIAYLKAAVQVDPNHWQAYQTLGSAYYQTGDQPNALSAMDQSLRLHPDNPSLRSFADNLRARTALAPSVPAGAQLPTQAAATTGSQDIPLVFEKGRWGLFHVGVGFASLGDMTKAADTINNKYSSLGAAAANGTLGFFLGAEGGISLDPENALGLSMEAGLLGGYQDSFNNSSVTASDSFSPVLMDLAPKYYHSFLLGHSRLRLEGGPALCFASVSTKETVDGYVLVDGPMTGFGFGGVFGLGWSMDLGAVALDLSLHARLGSVSNIQGKFKDPSGNEIQLGLVMDPNDIMLAAATDYMAANNFRWAHIDYTGGDAAIGIIYRY